MLAQLTISNFAIVRELEIDFHSGMTAITGETGAGKSIAIDALGLCLGGRAEGDMVRRGDMMSVDDVMDILSVPVIGTVPDDEDIVISTNQGEPLVGMNGYAGQAYLNICKRILGESVPFIQLDASPGFWSRISGFLKRA